MIFFPTAGGRGRGGEGAIRYGLSGKPGSVGRICPCVCVCVPARANDYQDRIRICVVFAGSDGAGSRKIEASRSLESGARVGR